MKYFCVMVGVVTLSAATLRAVYAPNLTLEQLSKPYTISCSVEGFWDDNYFSSPDKYVTTGPGGVPTVEDLPSYSSFGIQLTPEVKFHVPTERTLYSGGMSLAYRWYDNWQPPPGAATPGNPYEIDYTAQFAIDHKFSDANKLRVADSFYYSDEPTYLGDFGQIVTEPVVQDRGAYHNMGVIDFRGEFDPVNGYGVAYQNDFYTYDDDGPGSAAALLNRITQQVTLDYRRTISTRLAGLVGYIFSYTDYTADELLYPGAPSDRTSAERNALTQTLFLGTDWSVTPLIYTSVRAGAQFTEFVNINDSTVGPYVDASVTYNYMPKGVAQLGFRVQISPSDRAYTQFSTLNQGSDPTVSAQVYTPYLVVNYPVMRDLSASLLTQYQFSVYQGGQFEGYNESYLTLSLHLNYKINQYLSLISTYNYYWNSSDIPYQDYTRNQVLFGVRATY